MTQSPHLENGIAAEPAMTGRDDIPAEVPADVLAVAERLANNWANGARRRATLRRGIASAIMADRASRPSADHEAVRRETLEEAAKLAEGFQIEPQPGNEWRTGFNAGRVNAAVDIRAALRKPANEEGGGDA